MLAEYLAHPLVSILLTFIVEITSHLLLQGVPQMVGISPFSFTKDGSIILGQPVHAQYHIIIYYL